MAPPQGYHEIAAPASSATAPPSGYHEVTSPDATSPPSGAPQGIDLKAMGEKAFGLAGKFLDTPLIPQSVSQQYKIGNINPAEAISTPRNLAISGLTMGEGMIPRVAAGVLAAPEAGEEIKQTFAPNRTPMQRVESGVGAALASVPVLYGAGTLANDLNTAFIARMEDGLHNSSVNWLDNARIQESRKINNALQGAEAHSANLRQGIITAHAAANGNKPSIAMGSLVPAMDDAVNAFRNIQSSTQGADVSFRMPQFSKLIDAMSATNPSMTLDEVLKFRTLAGDLWRQASSDRDAAAIAKVRDTLTDIAKDASRSVGQSKQFDSYNKIWAGTHSGDSVKHLDKLLNSTNGISFFNTLNSDESKTALNRMADDLATHGLKDANGKPLISKDYFNKVRSAHQDIYDYVTRPTGFRGAFSNIGRRTLAGGAGFLGGSALGSVVGHPILGGIAGSTAGVGIVDRLAAIRNMSRLGNVDQMVRAEGNMGPRVEPDFGGGLSGQVIKNLEGGPKSGGTARAPITDDERQSFIEQQMNRPLHPQVRDAAAEVERLRAERAKRVGEATKSAVKKEQTGTLKGFKAEDDSATQQAQADIIQRYLADLKKAPPGETGKSVEELRQAINKKKGKK